ncbi:hypothetical protein BDP27DRAFT_1331984 [Rhodocollybia butyracea]|uniref:Uncharacterized protein n=1 Tax=Rhodocollybia butyracea TaxID=206335 RepID=A0A9P5U4A0_9AGAR|nr:hypothetical protein BDP27DRAFT_1331984 [Rhodocollybia butyracea]
MIGITFTPSFGQLSAGQQGEPDLHYFSFLDLNSAVMTIYMIANSIADSILLCRCYHLWASRKSVIAPPIILCTLNLALFFFGVINERKKDRNFDPPFLLTSAQEPIFGIATILGLAFCVVTLVTNLLLTALIAGRIFWLMKTTNKYLDGKSQVNCQRIKRIVIIIVESGCLYPLTVLVAACLVVLISPVKLVPIAAQTMGIAPTLIMVRVDLGLSIEHNGLEKLNGEPSLV